MWLTCDCNFFVKLASAIVLITAIIVNGIGNLLGCGDIIETTIHSCYLTTEESTTEVPSSPSTEDFTTTEKNTTTSQYTPIPTVVPSSEDSSAAATTTDNVAVYEDKWTKTFKESSNDVFFDSVATKDGGVVAVGVCLTKYGDTYSNKPAALIVKYDKDGKLEWKKAIGGNEATQFESVAILADGSIAAAGLTLADNLENTGEYKCPGTIEGIVARFNSSGDLIGNIRIYGGSADDMIYAISATSDGGYVIGGKSESIDGDMDGIEALNARKGFVLKCNPDGDVEWRSAINSTKGLATRDLSVNDAGCIYATIEAFDDAFIGNKLLSETDLPNSKYTIVLKLSPAGNLEWHRTVYGTGMTSLLAVEITDNGGCVIAGHYTSGRNGNTEGTFKDIYNGGVAGTTDGVIIKFSPLGDAEGKGVIDWICPLIGFENEQITDIVRIRGGYAISGFTSSTNRDFYMMPGTGDVDSFIFVINDNAVKRYVYIFDGSDADNARTITANKDSLFIAGSTNSGDGAFAECEAKGTSDSAVGFAGCLSLIN